MSDNLLDKVNTLEIQLAELKNELMRQPFERKVCIGELKYDGDLNIVVKYDGSKVVINSEKDSFDHIYPSDIIRYADGWSESRFYELQEAYNTVKSLSLKFHAGCIHQRQNWDLKKKIIVKRYTWSREYYNMRIDAADGRMPLHEYEKFQGMYEKVTEITSKHRTSNMVLVDELLRLGMIKLEKEETRLAVNTWPHEHSEGLLGVPCEVCNYSYGSAWINDPLPEKTLAFLRGL